MSCWTIRVPKDVWLGGVGKWLDLESLIGLMQCNRRLCLIYQEHPYVRWIKYSPEAGLRLAVMANRRALVAYYKEKLGPKRVKHTLSWVTTTFVKHTVRELPEPYRLPFGYHGPVMARPMPEPARSRTSGYVYRLNPAVVRWKAISAPRVLPGRGGFRMILEIKSVNGTCSPLGVYSLGPHILVECMSSIIIIRQLWQR
jgi:hypothetical protein